MATVSPVQATSAEVFDPGDCREQVEMDEELLQGGSRFRLVDLNAPPDDGAEESGSNELTVRDWAEAVYGHSSSTLPCPSSHSTSASSNINCDEGTSGTKKQKPWKQRPRLPAMPDEQGDATIQASALEKALQNFARRKEGLVVLPTVGMSFESMAEAIEFYNLYSWEVGFGIRCERSRKNTVKTKTIQDIVCSCNGWPRKENTRSIRCGCPAYMRIASYVLRVICSAAIAVNKQMLNEHKYIILDGCLPLLQLLVEIDCIPRYGAVHLTQLDSPSDYNTAVAQDELAKLGDPEEDEDVTTSPVIVDNEDNPMLALNQVLQTLVLSRIAELTKKMKKTMRTLAFELRGQLHAIGKSDRRPEG